MDTETEIELEVRIQEEIEKLLAEIEAGKDDTAPPESLDGTIGRLSCQDSLMQQKSRMIFTVLISLGHSTAGLPQKLFDPLERLPPLLRRHFRTSDGRYYPELAAQSRSQNPCWIQGVV